MLWIGREWIYCFKIIQLSPLAEGRTKQYQELLKIFFFFGETYILMTELLTPKDLHLFQKQNTAFLKSRDTFHVEEMNHFNWQKHIHS